MTRVNMAWTAAGVTGATASMMAGAIVWLLLTRPGEVSQAASAQALTPLVLKTLGLLGDALRLLVQFL